MEVSSVLFDFCNPMDCSPPGPSVHWDSPSKNTGSVQFSSVQSLSCVQLFATPWIAAHQWVAIPFSRGSSRPRDGTQISGIAGRFFTILSHHGGPKPQYKIKSLKRKGHPASEIPFLFKVSLSIAYFHQSFKTQSALCHFQEVGLYKWKSTGLEGLGPKSWLCCLII